MENEVTRYQSQSILFAEVPDRLALHQLKSLFYPNDKNVTVNIWRNHMFEAVADIMDVYTAFGRWSANITLSDYDDSLMFANYRAANLNIIWLDVGKYFKMMDYPEWEKWICGRLRSLRELSDAPTIVATWFDDDVHAEFFSNFVDALPGVFFADIASIGNEYKVNIIDERMAAVTGTRLSAKIQLLVARHLACRWIPAAVLPPIKAVAFDLDNTLYSGVLGEDGTQGVKLTKGHADLHAFIKSIRDAGIFIALISRNIESDVRELFRTREDMSLKWKDFTSTAVSWSDKAQALAEVADSLRISIDSILFVDDNIGELASVSSSFSNIHTIHAHEDAKITLSTLRFYPGLWRWKIEEDDIKRIADLEANNERNLLFAGSANIADYFHELGIRLIFNINADKYISRIAELCGKTNQFNMSLHRYGQADIDALMKRTDAYVVSVQLSDRLTDSGIVGVVIGEIAKDELLVSELCISCRALGRKIETDIILSSLKEMLNGHEVNRVRFRVKRGPRNQPAIKWLSGLLGVSEPMTDDEYSLRVDKVVDYIPSEGIELCFY